jgi:hypothetical protein
VLGGGTARLRPELPTMVGVTFRFAAGLLRVLLEHDLF